MNFNDIINAFCGLVFAISLSVGGYQAYKFVRHEVIEQSQRGLPSLERFSRKLTNDKQRQVYWQHFVTLGADIRCGDHVSDI